MGTKVQSLGGNPSSALVLYRQHRMLPSAVSAQVFDWPTAIAVTVVSVDTVTGVRDPVSVPFPS